MMTAARVNLTNFGVICLIFILGAPLQAAEYERTTGLTPIYLDASDLSSILATMSEAIQHANGPLTNGYEGLSVTISDEEKGQTVRWSGYSLPKQHLPSPGNSLRISYYRTDAPISDVSVDFGDMRRTITVKGGSFTEVEGLTAMLEHQFDSKSSPIGGQPQRFYFFMAAVSCFFFLANFSGLGKRVGIFFTIMAVATALSPLVVPWASIFPGFTFRETDPNWIIRYSAQFTFFGFLASVIIPGLQALLAKKTEPLPDKAPIKRRGTR